MIPDGQRSYVGTVLFESAGGGWEGAAKAPEPVHHEDGSWSQSGPPLFRGLAYEGAPGGECTICSIKFDGFHKGSIAGSRGLRRFTRAAVSVSCRKEIYHRVHVITTTLNLARAVNPCQRLFKLYGTDCIADTAE